MSTKTNPAVTEYLARTQAALADLPGAEVQEILEDIAPHLAEVAAELGENATVEALTERLGTPERYASELRAAAGYPPAGSAPPSPPKPRRLLPRFTLWALVLAVVTAFVLGLGGTHPDGDSLSWVLALCAPLFIALILIFSGQVRPAAVAELPEVHSARRAMESIPDNVLSYVRSLRPAWWLVRLAILGGVLLALADGARIGWVLWPAVVLVALIVGGARSRTDARWLWVVGPANALVFGLGLALLGVVWTDATREYLPTGYGPPPQFGTYTDGRYVENIYPFGPDGEPLHDVYLYDQSGRPIMITPEVCASRSEPSNRFPQPMAAWDEIAQRCQDRTDVPFTVAIPTQRPAPTTTPPPRTTTTAATTSPPPTTTAPPATK